MQFSGEYRFQQPPQSIWEALNDTNILCRTIPGCENIERLSATEFAATVRVSVGPMKLKFDGKIALNDLDPPWRYTISCSGNGGLAGAAKGQARVTMEAVPESPQVTGTLLRYQTEIALGGMIATLAQNMLEGTAARLSDRFFAHFAAQISLAEGAPQAKHVDHHQAPDLHVEAPLAIVLPKPQAGLHPVAWSIGLMAIVAVILSVSLR